MSEQNKGKEIYTYHAPWMAYSMSWCRNMDERNKFKIAVASYKEEYSNHLSIIQLQSHQSNGGKYFAKLFSNLCKTRFILITILKNALLNVIY